MSIWEELGIERTDNAREIKRAYAAKLKLVHPEEHPEEFQKLHEAYKSALDIAKNQANMPKRQAVPVVEKREKPSVADNAEATIDFNFIKETADETANEDSREKPISFDFKNKKNKTEETERENSAAKRENLYDFDGAIKRNTLRHDNEVMEKAEIVLKKAADLYNKKLFSSKQDWMDIFSSDAVEEIRYEPIFLKELCRFLKTHKIYENISNAVYDAFYLEVIDCKGADELEELYNIISRKRAEAYIRLENKIKLVLMSACFLIAALILLIFAGQYFISLALAVPAIILLIKHDKLKKRKEHYFD